MTCNTVNNNQTTNSTNPSSTVNPNSPVPNYPVLSEDFQEMLTAFNVLQKNLNAYLKDPNGKNASKELTNIQNEMGVLATLFNANNSNSFFAAANNNPTALEVINNLDGDVQSMIDLANNGSMSSLSSIQLLLDSPSLLDNVGLMFGVIYGDSAHAASLKK